MTQTAFLHMGANKTGSSAIQTWIRANTGTLDRAGIAVPAAFLGTTGNAPDLANAICLPAAEQTQGQQEMLRDFSTWLNGQTGDILFSAERFSILAAHGRMRRCAQYFKRRGFQVCGAFYLRNQIDRINSSIAQRTKRLRYQIDLTAPQDSIIDDRENWAACLDQLEVAGFDLRVGVYPLPANSATMPAHLMAKFGLRARLPATTDFSVGHANPSLGGLGVLLASNIAHLVGDLQNAQRHQFSQAILNAFQGLPDSPYNGFTQDEMDQIDQRFAEGNARLSRWLNKAEMSALATCKSRGRPTSPRRMQDLDKQQAHTMAIAIDRLCGTIAASSTLSAIVAPDAIRALLPDGST